MIKSKFLVIIFVWCGCLFIPKLSSGKILYPWRAAPTFAVTGESFEILLNNVRQAPVDSVVLKGPYSKAKLGINSIKTGKFVYDTYTDKYASTKMEVRVPEEVPEDLYDLLIYLDEEVYVSKKSVKVIREFNPQHTFIHISDTHVSRNWVGTPEEGYAKELELLDKFTEVANIIAPDFIMVTGDIIMHYTRFNANKNGWGDDKAYEGNLRPTIEEKYRNYFEGSNGFKGIHGLNSPVFSLPGNHDFYGFTKYEHKAISSQWNDLCGKRVYGFSYAGTRVLAADDFLGDPEVDIPEDAPMSGLQGKLFEEYLRVNGPGNLQILAQHRDDRIDTSFIDKHEIDILLHGHDHAPHHEYVGTTPTLHIRPGTPCRSGEIENWKEKLGFFRIFYVNGEDFKYSEPLRFASNPTANYEDIKLNLKLTYEKPNDGSKDSNSAILRNQFSSELPNCKIRFVMEKGHYEVKGGNVDQVIETSTFTVVDIRVDVKSESNTIVTIDSI